MPWWVQHRLHEPTLPREWLPVLRKLDRFIGDVLALRARSANDLSVDTTELSEDHDTIFAMCNELLETRHVVPEAEAIESFAVGVLRALHYQETVGPSVDRVGSKTLEHFRVDLPPGSRAKVLDALQSAFGLEQPALDKLELQLEDELKALEARKQIMAALTRLHRLEDSTDTFALFSKLFPDHPLRDGEVTSIRTATGLFLAIPFDGNQLRSPVGSRTEQQRLDVEAFLQSLAQFEQRYMAHFPVFGCFRGEDADPNLLSTLADHTDMPADSVARTLTTMVTIVPTDEIDQYIVHDAWGHGWQAMLFEFEDRYQEVAAYDRPPDIHARYAGVSLKEAVERFAQSKEDGVALFDRYLREAFGRRLVTSMSGLLAEVLADVVEYKFLFNHPEKRPLMPSSSFFKTKPTKLDLTLYDLPTYFDFAQKGFERFATRPKARAQVVAQLHAAGVQDSLPAITAFAERAASWMDEMYRAQLVYHPSDEGVQINVFCKMALHFTTLHAVFNHLYDELAALPPPPSPVGGFGDVLVFALASWFERDPVDHFWTTDDFLEEHFLSLWKRFVAAF